MDISQEEIERVMQNVVNMFLIPKFMSLGMNASGKWIESLEVSSSQNKGYISGADYTKYLVNGRSPGGRPPVQNLIDWAKAKFGYDDVRAKQMAFAVATKIAQSGTEYYPDGTDLLEVLNTPEVTNYINQEIGKHLILKTQIEILRNAKNIIE